MNHLLPRERLLERGANALTDAELIAVLLRTGNRNQDGKQEGMPEVIRLSEALLAQAGGLAGVFSLIPCELLETKGLGRTKSAVLLAVREIADRLFRSGIGAFPMITGVAIRLSDLFGSNFGGTRGFSGGVFGSANRLLHRQNMFRGSLTFATGSPRDILRVALRVNAASVLIAHNHPSQDPTPSPDDWDFTQQMRAACKSVGIHFLDHMVVCAGNNYVSMATEEWRREQERSTDHRNGGAFSGKDPIPDGETVHLAV